MRFALNKRHIGAVLAISCLTTPTASFSSDVGKSFGDGWVFLFDEKVEIYSNGWSGKPVLKENGHADVYIKGEGKTVEFNGILSINCESGSGHSWKTASLWEEPATKSQLKDSVPHDVLVNARTWFCN